MEMEAYIHFYKRYMSRNSAPAQTPLDLYNKTSTSRAKGATIIKPTRTIIKPTRTVIPAIETPRVYISMREMSL